MGSTSTMCIGESEEDNNEHTQIDETEEEDSNSSEGWISSFWCHTSKTTLQKAAQDLLECVETPYSSNLVNIGKVPTINSEKDLKILTVALQTSSSDTPIVLIHGLASGSALWALNLDDLASFGRPLYAIDLPGFGQSSRPKFSSDAMTAETQFVDSIEAWRQEMKLEKFFLIGHSLGGFLSTSYSLRFPERIQHLMLIDPWGFQDPPNNFSEMNRISLYQKLTLHVAKFFNPCAGLRLAGPIGPFVMKLARPELIGDFKFMYPTDAAIRVSNYVFHANARDPTGEVAFRAMSVLFLWPHFPMHSRLHLLDEKIPITFMYGAQSLVDHCPIEEIKSKRPESSYVHQVVFDCGHHVYITKRKEFFETIKQAFSLNL